MEMAYLIKVAMMIALTSQEILILTELVVLILMAMVILMPTLYGLLPMERMFSLMILHNGMILILMDTAMKKLVTLPMIVLMYGEIHGEIIHLVASIQTGMVGLIMKMLNPMNQLNGLILMAMVTEIILREYYQMLAQELLEIRHLGTEWDA